MTSYNVSFWEDYGDYLKEALASVRDGLKHREADTSDIIQDACFHRFKRLFNLYLKVLKKALSYEKVDSNTPRDVLGKAFQFNLIDDEAAWLAMLDDRNKTSHTYKKEEAVRVFKNLKTYLPILEKTYASLKTKYDL